MSFSGKIEPIEPSKIVFPTDFRGTGSEAAIQDNYKMDYRQMKEQMIYGDDVLEFEMLISRLTELMSRIKAIK